MPHQNSWKNVLHERWGLMFLNGLGNWPRRVSGGSTKGGWSSEGQRKQHVVLMSSRCEPRKTIVQQWRGMLFHVKHDMQLVRRTWPAIVANSLCRYSLSLHYLWMFPILQNLDLWCASNCFPELVTPTHTPQTFIVTSLICLNTFIVVLYLHTHTVYPPSHTVQINTIK